jgi:HAD superfamily hydrolase (TIGR01509 family)
MRAMAVLWDMDGTLVDSEPLHVNALRLALRSQGIEPPADLHHRTLGRAAIPVHEMLRDEFGLTLEFDPWIRLKYSHYLKETHKLKVREETHIVFRKLRDMGVGQAIVSNSDRIIVDANLNAVGMSEPGFKTVSRNDVLNGKPDPEPFLRGAWLLGTEPNHSVVVEDSATGALGGLAAGIKTLVWPQMDIDIPKGAVRITSTEHLMAEIGIA